MALTAGPASASDVLLLIHGFPLHAAMWQPQFDAPPADWRVFAPDLPGFGSSASDAGVDRMTMDMFADDIVTQLSAEGIERVVVCGLSMGGYVAFSLLRRAPEMVRALVLCDTRAAPDSDEARNGRISNARRVIDEGTAGLVDDMLPKLLSAATRRHRPDLEAEVRQIMMAAPPRSVSAALLGMAERDDSTPLLSTIRVPTLVVSGADDSVIPVAEARDMADAIRGAELRIIDSAGHLPNLEQPAEFNRILAAFLDGVAS